LIVAAGSHKLEAFDRRPNQQYQGEDLNSASLHLTAAGRPRLSSAVGVALQIAAWVGLGARSVWEFSVDVDARSNRAVIAD